jgi:hypothetical protein
VDGTEDMLWDDSEEDGDVSSDSKEDEGRLWRWRQWHWLVKVDSIWHALCVVYEMNIIS